MSTELAQSTALIYRPQNAAEMVQMVKQRIDTIAGVCPFGRRHAERIVETFAIVAIRMGGDELMKCLPQSVIESVTKCARLGLDPSGHNNGAHFVRYGNTLQLLVGYNGLIELACRSGRVSHIDAVCVYEGDEFDVTLGTSPQIVHRPSGDADRTERARAVYAIAWMPNGMFKFEVMSEAEVERIRGMSKSKNSPAWQGSWNEMARKTVVRRLVKTLPSNPEMNEAIAHSDEADGFDFAPRQPRVAPAPEQDEPPVDADEVRAKREAQGEGDFAGYEPITVDDIDDLFAGPN